MRCVTGRHVELCGAFRSKWILAASFTTLTSSHCLFWIKSSMRTRQISTGHQNAISACATWFYIAIHGANAFPASLSIRFRIAWHLSSITKDTVHGLCVNHGGTTVGSWMAQNSPPSGWTHQIPRVTTATCSLAEEFRKTPASTCWEVHFAHKNGKATWKSKQVA